MKIKKLLCLLLSIIMIISMATVSLASENDIYEVISTGIGSSEAYLSEKLTEMHNDAGVTYGSDWAIITMLRGGKTIDAAILAEYTDSLTETVKGWNANVKPTDAAKATLAFTIMGKDTCNIEGVNLIDLICNSERLESGTNELAYSLLAIYASNAEVPQDALWDKDEIIEKLLTFQTESGGFGLFDTETADVDMTAICVQALAPYKSDETVATAIEKAVDFLANAISEDWDYDNPNTTAQVLLALASLGIDVTDPANGFGNGTDKNIVTSLEAYRNTDGNGYIYESSVNTMATYQIMQAYDAYRKVHKDGVSYWDFGTDGQVYDDLATPEDPEPEENEAEPIDVFVTIVDDGNIVTDKNGGYVGGAKVTVSDLDKNGMLTVDEALYATHEAFYDGGANAGYSTFVGDYGLSLAVLWGKGTAGVSASAGYYLNNASCWSLNDVVNAGDYLTAFNYYDTIYWSDTYSYFNENAVSVQEGSTVTLTLNALGYDENWNQVASPYAGAKIEILGADYEVLTTDAEGKVEIATSQLEPGTYYAVAYTDAKNIVPCLCKITVTKRPSSGGGSSAPRKLRITVKVMVHGDNCGNSYTYKNNSENYDELAKAQAKIKESIEQAQKKIEGLRKEDSLVFPMFSDLHTEKYDHEHMDRLTFTLKHIAEKIGCDMVVNLGDNFAMLGRDIHITNTELKKRFRDLLTAIYEATGLPLVCVNGNHDGVGTDFFSADFWNGIVKGNFGNTLAVYDDCGSYYYLDFEKSNTRCIILSVPYDSDMERDMPTPLWKFAEKQLSWLKNVALNTDKDAIILCHVPLNYKYDGDREWTLGVWDGEKERTSYVADLCGGIEDDKEAISILEDFVKKGKGKLAAVLSGHTHEDALWYYGEGKVDKNGISPNLLPCVQITTASACYTSQMKRMLGISVDIVVWTPSLNKLNIIRVGDGEDKEINIK